MSSPIGFDQPVWLLAGLLLVGAAWFTWRRHPPPLGRRQARLALGLRVVLLSALGLALALPTLLTTPSTQALLIVADRSASTTAARDQVRSAVLSILGARPAADYVGLVGFGRDAAVEAPAGPGFPFSDFGATVNQNYTDIEGALRLAGASIPDDRRRHVLLVTDGRQNVGDAVAQARALSSRGTRVDVLPLDVQSGPEVYVDTVRLPAAVPPGARPHLVVTLQSNVATTAAARILVDNTEVGRQQVTVAAGVTTIELTLPPAAAGFHHVHVETDPARDTFSENNTGEALYQVLGTQDVLVVEGAPGRANNVVAALRAASISPSVVDPAHVPASEAGLASYQAVVLVDVAARDLGDLRMAAIATAVHDLGIGLVAFGGPSSLGPGGYAGSPLETALPVNMEISDRSQKPPVAVVLVLETMENQQADAVMRSAAKAVVDHLTPRDLVGITDGNSGLVVPLQQVTDPKSIDRQIDGLQLGDPPSYGQYIQAAGDALKGHSAANRHVIVVGDGDSSGDYGAQLETLHGAGITTSAIGINVHQSSAAMAQMHAIATSGHGRFYESDSPTQIPQLLLEETEKGLKPWIVTERFRPGLGAPSGALGGIDLNALPRLDGYVASTLKPASEVVLQSPQHDPVLAQWQYGLGRAATWTSDTEGRWSAELLGWKDGGRLLANIVQWTLPLAADPTLGLEASVVGDHGHLIAAAPGLPPDSALSLVAVAPDLSSVQVALQSTGQGRFEGDFPATQVGSYLLHVTSQLHGRATHTATAGLAVSFSPEFRFLGTDRARLREIATAGGGTVLTDPSAAFSVPVPPVQVSTGLAPLFLLLAAVLLPIDVATRRLLLRRADLRAWRAAVTPPSAPPVAAEATVQRLRSRLQGTRDDGHAATENATPEAAPQPGTGPESIPAPPRPPQPAATDEGPPGDDSLASRLLQRRRGG